MIVSTPIERRRGPDEWMLSPPGARATKFGDNASEWTVKKGQSGNLGAASGKNPKLSHISIFCYLQTPTQDLPRSSPEQALE